MNINSHNLQATIVVTLLLLRCSLFSFGLINILYYLCLVIFAISSLRSYCDDKKRYNIDLPLLCFLLVGLVSIIMNDINPFFQPIPHLVGFALIAVSFGPLCLSKKNISTKITIISYFKKVSLVMVTITLMLKILGISLPGSHTAFGLFYHDITCSQISYLTALLVLDDITYKKGNKKLNIILFIICVSCGIFTGSRGALGSFLLGSILYILFKSRGNKKIKYIGIIGVLLALAYTTNPFGMFDHFVEKMSRDSEDVSYVTSGRDIMILDRISDFYESPIYGVGFSSMRNIEFSKVDFDEGIIESGSSWFSILGSTGALGLLFYVLTFIMDIRKPWKQRENVALIVCTCFLLSHSSVEGFAVSFGSPQCALLWLFLGVIRSRIDYYIKTNKCKI